MEEKGKRHQSYFNPNNLLSQNEPAHDSFLAIDYLGTEEDQGEKVSFSGINDIKGISTIDTPALDFFVNQPTLLETIQLLHEHFDGPIYVMASLCCFNIHNYESFPSSSIQLEAMLFGVISNQLRSICYQQNQEAYIYSFIRNITHRSLSIRVLYFHGHKSQIFVIQTFMEPSRTN